MNYWVWPPGACVGPVIASRDFMCSSSLSCDCLDNSRKKVSNTSCNRTSPYVEHRSAWSYVPTHFLVPTCLFNAVLGFQQRLQSASLSLCLCLSPLLTEGCEEGQLSHMSV